MTERAPVTILLMDDAAVIRQLMIQQLAGLRHVTQILQAADAQTALQLFVAYHPQIAILDIQVPGDKNGLEVLKDLKTRAPAPAVIMLTNHATPRYRRACQQAGADYFFDKSTEFEQVAAAVAALIQLAP